MAKVLAADQAAQQVDMGLFEVRAIDLAQKPPVGLERRAGHFATHLAPGRGSVR